MKWVDLDQGWQPCKLAFCGSKKAWAKNIKRLGFDPEPFPEMKAAAVCTRLTKGNGTLIIVSMLKPGREVTNLEVVGALAHECLHALDFMIESMNETPGDGFEWRAYAMQMLVMMTLSAYADCHGRQPE